MRTYFTVANFLSDNYRGRRGKVFNMALHWEPAGKDLLTENRPISIGEAAIQAL